MTDDELLQLKELAVLAHPFLSKSDKPVTEDMMVGQRLTNATFFLEATHKVPLMVDELLAHRKTRYRMKQGVLG